MKLKKYLESLNKLAKDHPESLDLDIIYASDDEENSFNPVNFTATMGHVLEDGDGYIQDGDINGIDGVANSLHEDQPINAVCLN